MEVIPYPFQYRRLRTRTVRIGDLCIGGDHPVLVQSMLMSPTREVAACLNEIRSLQRVGCRLIRLTVPSRKDLEAVPEIRRLMAEEGIRIPLVADIHYAAALAVDACECFEKIRINPGNYTDRPKSARGKSVGSRFEEGRDKLRLTIGPLVRNLKRYGRALRIGVNQGSLSARMMERFGDTPLGMVESALEMIELFEVEGFDQLVVSLKSSNPLVVQKAYRLLVQKQAGSLPVALHLGVTEAGSGSMGRCKSLVGIGVLLADGIGDTIRVSLTEPGTNEIVFAQAMLQALQQRIPTATDDPGAWSRPLNEHRVNNQCRRFGPLTLGDGSPLKLGRLRHQPLPAVELPLEADFVYWRQNGVLGFGETDDVLPLREVKALEHGEASMDDVPGLLVNSAQPLTALRRLYERHSGRRLPPVGMIYAPESAADDWGEDIQWAGLFSEGLLDFVLIAETIPPERLERLLCLLQAARAKLVMTDYITCPGCGRTLFDLMTTAEKVRQATGRLKGLKIGIMGCIVNGPGEMADADFGYVGSGAGKIDLYEGQHCVRRGIDEAEAVDQLIELIKAKGRWH